VELLSILNSVDAIAWVNGRLVEPGAPVLAYDDHGLVGDGVFEAIKVVDRRPFALTRHLQRLAASAAPLDIDVDLDRVRQGIDAVLATDAASASPLWLRVTVTPGAAPMGTAGRGHVATIVAAVAPMAPWGPTADVAILPWARNDHGAIAGLKTISYAENVVGLRHAKARGADEGVFPNTSGRLCEGTGSNVYVAVEGRLVTPPLTSGCLAGVTRALLLEWVPELIEEGDVPIDALASADEACLTSTSRDVHPIGTVDGRPLAAAPGPLTRKVMDVFAERAAADADP
jgi:branched-chain amino acid aminotransferase